MRLTLCVRYFTMVQPCLKSSCRSSRLLFPTGIVAEWWGYAFPRHVHTTFVIEVVEAGVDSFRAFGREYFASAGDVIVLPPMMPHDGRRASEETLRYRTFYPSAQLVESVARGRGESSAEAFELEGIRLASPVIQDVSLAAKLVTAHRALEGVESGDAHGLLCEALEHLVSQYGVRRGDEVVPNRLRGRTTGSRDANSARNQSVAGAYGFAAGAARDRCDELDRLSSARAVLLDQLMENVPVSELASVAGMSESHFARRFCDAFGIAPHEMRMSLRIEEAMLRIQSGVSLAAAATCCGFSDQAHLTRKFKRLTGITPGKFRSSRNVQYARG